MLVVTLVLAGVGFALLIVALTTGSLIWAWACIAICVAGAVLLLVSALTSRKSPASRASTGVWPVISTIRSPKRHTTTPNRPSTTHSHSAMRTERRTSRTEWRRRPISAAISFASGVSMA